MPTIFPLALLRAGCNDLEMLKEKSLREIHRTNGVKAPFTHHTSIFNQSIMVIPSLDNFKMLSILPYDTMGDPIVHVQIFYLLNGFQKDFKAS